MAFFDKIAAAAKSAKESANTTLEIGKLKLKIKNENDNIEQFKTQIGDLLWAQYLEGTVTDPQVIALCESRSKPSRRLPKPPSRKSRNLLPFWSVIAPSAVLWFLKRPSSATTAAHSCKLR